MFSTQTWTIQVESIDSIPRFKCCLSGEIILLTWLNSFHQTFIFDSYLILQTSKVFKRLPAGDVHQETFSVLNGLGEIRWRIGLSNSALEIFGSVSWKLYSGEKILKIFPSESFHWHHTMWLISESLFLELCGHHFPSDVRTCDRMKLFVQIVTFGPNDSTLDHVQREQPALSASSQHQGTCLHEWCKTEIDRTVHFEQFEAVQSSS